MSELSESVEATILVADFVNVDSAGKANIVGLGLRMFQLNPGTKATTPFGILVTVSAPVPLGESPALEILLTTATGQIVQLPGGANGNQALRISQNVDFPEATPPPGFNIPKGEIPSTVQFAINFSTGLPLKAGNSYQFRVQIDHDVVATYSFYVLRQPTGPVVG